MRFHWHWKCRLRHSNTIWDHVWKWFESDEKERNEISCSCWKCTDWFLEWQKGVRSVFRLFDCSKKDLFWTMDEKGMKMRRCLLGGMRDWECCMDWFLCILSWMESWIMDECGESWKTGCDDDFEKHEIGCESILKWFVTLYNSLEMLIKRSY